MSRVWVRPHEDIQRPDWRRRSDRGVLIGVLRNQGKLSGLTTMSRSQMESDLSQWPASTRRLRARSDHHRGRT
jgi:hypothetical protein